MKIVMPCASRKHASAGYFMSGNCKVMFVADPASAPLSDGVLYARPDDSSPEGKTWRQLLSEYNTRRDNPFGLATAARLYENPIYPALTERFGAKNTFILSAGWGLVSSDYLLPMYDITFKKLKDGEAFKMREKHESYSDHMQLLADTNDEVVFIGVKDYINFFVTLTQKSKAHRTILFNSIMTPHIEGCRVIRYETNRRTNWQYSCAADLLAGNIKL